MSAHLMNGQAKKPEPSKAVATLRARLALRGYELHQLEGGSWIVRRWGLSVPLDTLSAVERFAESAGA